MNDADGLPEAHVFTQVAMNTTFTYRFRNVDLATARSAARECCDRVEGLEARLSRYLEASDVARINLLPAGETLYISDECYQCLLQAANAYVLTCGLFDVTLGTQIEHRKTQRAGPPPPLAGRLIIHPDVPAVTCEAPGRAIDLGGIGKGFALEQLKHALLELEVCDALLAAGASSLLAFGPTSWPVDMVCGSASRRLGLRNAALSASGTGMQGQHIIHPAGDEAMPPTARQRLWVLAQNATTAEVWSTALMLVEPQEAMELLEGQPDVTAVYAGCGDEISAWLER